jgi:hypothetical protein
MAEVVNGHKEFQLSSNPQKVERKKKNDHDETEQHTISQNLDSWYTKIMLLSEAIIIANTIL